MRQALVKLTVIFILQAFVLSVGAQQNIFLISRTLGEKIVASGDTIRTFGFAQALNQQPPIPGPLIDINEGDSVIVELWNVSQGHPHTVHLHGLDVPQDMDGVPMLSFEVDHMEHGYYHFRAPHAGTYLYHCHVGSTVHVQAGMYGPIIIRPPDGSNTTWTGGYAFDNELMLFMSEIDPAWHSDSLLDHPHDTSAMIQELEIPRYDPEYFLVSGFSDGQIPGNVELNTSVNAVNYLRLVNIGYYYNKVIIPSGLAAMIVDSDGRPLPAAELTDTIEVYPGERYGVICMSSSEFVDSIEVQYLDMITGEVRNSQYVKTSVQGFNAVQDVIAVHNVNVYPNPARDLLQITFNLSQSGNVKFELIDVHGRRVGKATEMSFENGTNQFGLSISGIAEGRYLLIIRAEDQNVVKSFIKVSE